MKNFLLLLLVVPLIGFSQTKQKRLKPKEMMAELEGKWEVDDNNNVTFVKIIDSINLPIDEIYNRSLAYFTYNYVSGDDVIQIQDKENRLIIGKGLFPNVYTGIFILSPTEFSTHHLVRVDIKDNRVRLLITITGYKKKVYYTDGDLKIYDRNIQDVYPLSDSKNQKNLYINAFYYSYLSVLKSMENIEKAIISGNTSSSLENENW